MKRLPLHAAILTVLLSLLRPGASVAESGSAKGLSSSATQLIESATAAIAAANYPAAYQALVTLYPQAPAQATYYLARLAAAEGQAVATRDLLRRFLADQSLEAADPLRAEAQTLLSSLPNPEAGEVSVGAPRGAMIQLDGRLVGTLPLSLPLLVATGMHRLQVSLGRWRAESSFQVRTARSVELRFKSGSDLAVVSRPAVVLLCDEYSDEASASSEPLTHAVEAVVKHENFAVLSRQVALAYAPDIASCEPPPQDQMSASEARAACCAALAQRFAIERTLHIQLSQKSGKWSGELGLREPDVEGEVRGGDFTCDGCGTKEAGQRLSDALGKLFVQADQQGRGSLQIGSTPPGAEVVLAGRLVGSTPYARKIWAGSYAVELRRPGYTSASQSVSVVADQPTNLSLDLQPEQAVASPSAIVGPPRRPIWRIAAGAGGIAAGVLMLGFGISALSVNGTCSLDGLPACDGLYRTGPVGGALVGIGAALMVGGGVLIAWPPAKSK